MSDRYRDPEFRRWVALNDPLLYRRAGKHLHALLAEKRELDAKFGACRG